MKVMSSLTKNSFLCFRKLTSTSIIYFVALRTSYIVALRWTIFKSTHLIMKEKYSLKIIRMNPNILMKALDNKYD